MTVEEATLVASGALADSYSGDADPVPTRFEWTAVELEGEAVWRIDATVDVTISGNRTEHKWRLWIGADEEQPVVRRSERLVKLTCCGASVL